MNTRVAKEFKALRLPWLVGLAGGFVAPVSALGHGTGPGGDLLRFLQGAGTAATMAALALLAAMTFGNEFQFRTLPLLLSQPVPRQRLWREKHFALAGTVLTIGVACLVGMFVNDLFGKTPARDLYGNATASTRLEGISESLGMLLVIITTMASAGYWTFATRSTIGSLAFNGASQFLIAGLLALVLERFACWPTTRIVTFGVSGILYAATFHWLGWRTFARWELKEGAAGGDTGTRLDSPNALRLSLPLLRCQPHSALANLLRKELRLLRPLFLLATLFTAVWVVVLALFFLSSAHRDYYAGTLNVLTAIYVPLMLVLSGTLSLGEERSLGVAAWHLTLPVAPVRQWLVKLLVSLFIGAVLSLGLPTVLAAPALPVTTLGLWGVWLQSREGWYVLLLISGLVFVSGFWAVAHFGTTVRASLAALLTLAGLGFTFAVGNWCATATTGLLTTVFRYWIARRQLSPEFFGVSSGFYLINLYLGILFLVGLRQSFLAFRKSQVGARGIVTACALLGVLAWLGGLLGGDWTLSSSRAGERIRHEIYSALIQGTPRVLSPEQTIRLSPADLAATGRLSPSTREWLRGATITAHRFPGLLKNQKDPGYTYTAEISLPSGTACSFGYFVPVKMFENQRGR
jgi:hypothetical protein